ncbi:MAG: PKD domain-containing protein, partial [Flavobacteriales bacterium]|nr:PKD domain-containing protein [Flavobacteriales bacterium]
MTLILLKFFLKKIQLECSNCHYYFLLLIFMFYSKSTTSQVVSDFTTINLNTGCGSLVVEFEDLSTGNPDTWLWDFGNGNSSSQQNPIAVYSSPGLYTVKLTVSDASTQDVHIQTDFVKVYAQPTVSLDQNSTLFCVPEEVLFTDETQSANNIVAWMWDFGDGGSSNLQNPIYEYQNNGVFTVSLSVVDDKGCESLVIFDNLIDAKKVPVSDFVSDIDFSCNSTELVTFTNNSEFAYSYFWNFGDGTTSSNTNPTHNYNSGVFDVYLVSDNSVCTDTLFLNNLIEIGGVMTTDFTSNVNTICESDSVSFSDETLNSADTWFWDFGDGNTSSLQNPIHQYNSGGNYTVKLSTTKNGSCLSEEIKVDFIEVFDSPSIDFDVNNQTSCNPPLIVDFYENTLNITDWFWEMENGFMSTNQNPVVNFTDSGSFDVTLTVTDDNGCSSRTTKSDFIKIDDFSADFNVSDSIICEDDFVDFLDNTNSIFNIISYNWDFGDGNTSILQNPQNQYLGINIFDVSLIVKNSIGCTDQKSISSFIKTVGPPTTDFTVDRIVSCAGETITFTDLSSSSAVINNWDWDFGDGGSSTTQNPNYQYNLIGNFDVTLITGEGICTDTLIKNYYIEIIEPSSFFIAKYNCDEPLMIDFLNHSVGADVVEWDFGDGFTSTDFDPTHSYSNTGVYNVSLRVTNNATLCTHEYIEQVNVFFPEADFTYLINPNNSLKDSVVCLPKKRSHIDIISPNVRNYRVDWGDGYIGVNRQDHLYDTPGVYDVTLMITDNYGCKDTLVYNDMFRVTEVETDFTASNVQGCNDLSVDFEDLSSVTSSVFWDFGDGNSSTQNNPTNVYLVEGIYDVTLFSTSIEGCLDTLVRQEYIVFEKPILNFTFSDNAICKDETVVFVDSSKGLSLDYNWDFGDGNTSVLKSPQHNYQNVGFFPVSLTITDTFGCTVVNNTELIEVQNVQVDFSSNLLSSNCPPVISTFTNNSSGVNLSYNWSFGDGLTSSQENPSHLYSTSGDFDVRLIIEDNFSCKDTLVMSNMISIFGPMGTFNYSSDVVCKSDSVVFTANVQNVDSYLWDFGDGIFSTDSNPSHLYSNGDFYSPQLIIENTSACQLIVTSDDSIEVREIIVDAGINQTICLGDSISLLAIGSATNYNWISSQNMINENS